MKEIILVGLFVALGSQVNAKVKEYYFIKDKEVLKIEAIRALIQNNETQVMRCVAQELTPDVKMKNKQEK